MEVHDSFLKLSQAQVNAHMNEMASEHIDGPERSRALQYLRQVIADDAALLVQYRNRSAQARRKLDEITRESRIDFRKHTSLFAKDASDRWTRMKAKLLVANSDVRGKAGMEISEDVVINGDKVMLDGVSNGGSARAGKLTCGLKVNGKLHISGDQVRVRGVHFLTTSDKCITFSSASNIVIEDCIFDGPDMFWYGVGVDAGDVTLRNCLVRNFSSWLLIDFNTGSATATTALRNVTIDQCQFKDCAGSIAARGMVSNPIKLCTYTDNVFEYGTSQHASFWSSLECNNMQRCICTGNVANGVKSGDRGFFQCWSQSTKDWEITFEKNTIDGFKFGLQLAASATFYNPDYHSDRHKIHMEAGAFTNTDYQATYSYPWLTGTFAPENASRLPGYPTSNFVSMLPAL
jgi:hypothetical protein